MITGQTAQMSVFEKICCLLNEWLGTAYGDPESPAANITLTATYTALGVASSKAMLIIRNTGIVDIEIAFKANAATGLTLQPGDPLTIYDFRGTVFGRGDTGTVNVAIIGRW